MRPVTVAREALQVPSAIRVGWFVPGTDYVSVGPGTDQTVTIQSRDLLQGLRAVQVTDPRSGRVFSVELATDFGWGAGLKDADGTTDTENGIEVNQSYGVRVLRTYRTQRTLLIPSAPVGGVRRTAWAPGQTFTSSTGGVAVTVVSTTASTATLRVRTAAAPGTHLVPVVTAPTSVRPRTPVDVVVTGTPDATVRLERRYSGESTYTRIRTLRLDAAGRAVARFTPARVFAVRAADTTRPAVYGPVRVVQVR